MSPSSAVPLYGSRVWNNNCPGRNAMYNNYWPFTDQWIGGRQRASYFFGGGGPTFYPASGGQQWWGKIGTNLINTMAYDQYTAGPKGNCYPISAYIGQFLMYSSAYNPMCSSGTSIECDIDTHVGQKCIARTCTGLVSANPFAKNPALQPATLYKVSGTNPLNNASAMNSSVQDVWRWGWAVIGNTNEGSAGWNQNGKTQTLWWWWGVCPDISLGFNSQGGFLYWNGPQEGPSSSSGNYNCWDNGLKGGSRWCNYHGLGRGRGCSNAGMQGCQQGSCWGLVGSPRDNTFTRLYMAGSSTICDEPAYWDTQAGSMINPGALGSKPPCTCLCFQGWTGPTCNQAAAFIYLQNNLRDLQTKVDAAMSAMLPQLATDSKLVRIS